LLVATLAIVVSLGLLSCSPKRRPSSLADFQLLVFPGETELGGSVAAVISSNHVPGADAFEDYTLERARVEIRIKDAADVEWPADVRAVFPLAASRTSRLAQALPGAWVTAVLFDLPTAAAAPTFALGNNASFVADVIVRIDDESVLDDAAIGSIRITGLGGEGVGGQPTDVLWPTLTEFELGDVVARFRPVLDQDQAPGGGFPNESGGTVIGGIEGDLVYFSPCFTDAEAYAGTEAANAGIHLGPQQVVGGAGFYVYRRLALTYPSGFTLTHPVGGADDALGEGPLIDIAFDRPNQSIFDCEAIGFQLWLWNLYVVRPDGSTIVDQRGTGSLGASSDLFALHSIPAD
jgi:hypothetical protein